MEKYYIYEESAPCYFEPLDDTPLQAETRDDALEQFEKILEGLRELDEDLHGDISSCFSKDYALVARDEDGEEDTIALDVSPHK